MSLQVRNLSFKYHRDNILENISFDIEAGNLLGLLGPNGMGKSTLLKCISHILPPQSGNIIIFEKNLRSFSIKEKAKIISYVPQSTYSSFPMSVVDTVLMGRIPYINMKITKNDKDKAFAALEMLNLEDYAFKNINELSGGERQQVIIARSIAQEPSLLILDEPTSNLDLKNQMDVLEKIKNIVKEKKLIAIIAIHDINLASMFCDKLLLLKDRTIIAEGQNKDIINENNIRQVYGVETTIIKVDNRHHVVLKKKKTST
ncbi:MAG: ABC transporter ATP-binding protein [Clostridiaceae bacterium]|nr:ABC transporter ATP-binding protein [Clostridiaceae bacterium]